MNDIKFTSLTELYNRLLPALKCRKSEIKRLNISYLKEEDIWNYLKEKKWNASSNLTLADMVSDILNVDEYLLDEYVKDKMKKIKREIIIDDNNLL